MNYLTKLNYEVNCEDGKIFRINEINKRIEVGFQPKPISHVLVGYVENGRSYQACLCRIIYMSKHGNIPENHEIYHIDNNKLNNKIHNLGIRPSAGHRVTMPYTQEEDNTLLDNKDKSWSELQKILPNRSERSIRQRFEYIVNGNKNKPTSKQRRWTVAEDNQLRHLLISKTDIKTISKQLSRSITSIHLRARNILKIKVSNCLPKKFQQLKSTNFYMCLKGLKRRNFAECKCCICGYSKSIELHHIDGNNRNNNKDNISTLCPNHHAEIENGEHQDKELFCVWRRVIPASEVYGEWENLDRIHDLKG